MVREVSALNLGQQNEIAQVSDEAAKAHPVSNDSKHLSSDCFAQIEFQREQLQIKSRKGLSMAIKRRV